MIETKKNGKKQDLIPILLEINQMPSFATGSPLDYKIKRGLIIDTIRLLNLNLNRKRQYKNERKAKLEARLLGPAKINPDLMDEKAFAEDAFKKQEAQKNMKPGEYER